MAFYKVILKPSVHKDLRVLPKPIIRRVFETLEALQENPLPRQAIKLAGAEHLYRIRIGNYRLIYAISHQERQVTIYYVRYRREVYRQI